MMKRLTFILIHHFLIGEANDIGAQWKSQWLPGQVKRGHQKNDGHHLRALSLLGYSIINRSSLNYFGQASAIKLQNERDELENLLEEAS